METILDNTQKKETSPLSQVIFVTKMRFTTTNREELLLGEVL